MDCELTEVSGFIQVIEALSSPKDRILFKSCVGFGAVTGCGYDSCRILRISDHRPVYAVFRVRLEPCTNVDG